MISEQAIEFVPLKDYPDYEILSQYPFTIRRKDNHYEVKEKINKSNGYPSVCINCDRIDKHRIIAKQFIPNDDPEHKKQVDHKNKDRTDYHLENLRWCTSSDNNKNVSSRNGIKYEFIDDIPDDAMVVDFYELKTERREFNENEYYYYYNQDTNEDIFYRRITDDVYRILHINKNKAGNKYVNIYDKNNKLTSMMINRFKIQHDITVLE